MRGWRARYLCGGGGGGRGGIGRAAGGVCVVNEMNAITKEIVNEPGRAGSKGRGEGRSATSYLHDSVGTRRLRENNSETMNIRWSSSISRYMFHTMRHFNRCVSCK